jgi:hypothetical protein
MSELDAWTSGQGIEPEWRELRAHLLSQEAEIDRLSQESAQQFIRARDWAELSGKNEDRASLAESRLAAATAEIEQLQAGLAKHVNRVCELQSRLAVADALLSRCFVQIGELTKGLDPHDPIYVELQRLSLDWTQHGMRIPPHLSENAHG